MVRVVLDTSASAPFRYAVQGDRKTLVLDLAGAHWAAAPRWTAAKEQMLSSYQATADAGGVRMVIRASREVRVRQASHFPPGGDRGHRIVLDVEAADTPASAQRSSAAIASDRRPTSTR